MVEVDPMILLAAGSIAVGMATVAFCLRSSSKKGVPQHSSVDRSNLIPVLKPRKKQTRTAKKVNVPTSTVTTVQSEESEIAAIMADLGPIDLTKKSTKKVKDSQSSRASESVVAATKKNHDSEDAAREAEAEREEDEAELAASLADALLAEEEEKRNKKPKESAQQKIARVERQKIAKMKKVEEEEMSKKAAIKLAATERELATSIRSKDSTAPAQADGWAVVEEKRKVKVKVSSTSAAATSEESAQDSAVSADFIKSDISVDSKKIGIIIGPKGVTLHNIQKMCGVEINTPRSDRDATGPVIVNISGPVEGVRKASQAIFELCTKGYSKMLAPEDFKEGSIEVHPSYLSEIIGKSGANIRAIQEFTGVKLAIPQVARDHNLPVKITVAGSKEKVQQAKDLIVELTKYYHTSVTHPGQIHAEMDVPSILYNYIIGARGSEIKHIQANFKVSVHIPNVDTISKNILIVGDPPGVKGAEKYIQKIIDQAVADKEHAEKMADSWVDGEGETEESTHEKWMDQYVHPSRVVQASTSSNNGGAGTGSGSGVFDEYNGGLQSGGSSASSASASATASASAWGSSILTSSEGW